METIFVSAFIETIIGSLFLLSSIYKLANYADFHATVSAYQLLPRSLSKAFGWILPPLELGVGLGLIFHSGMPVRVIAIALFGMFAFAVGVNLLRGRSELNCGCSFANGEHDNIIGWPLVFRNIGLAGILILCDRLAPAYWITDGLTPSTVAGAIAFFAVQAGFSLTAAWRENMAKFPKEERGLSALGTPRK